MISYEEQAKRYGMSTEDYSDMLRENSEWWEAEVIKERQENGED